MEIFVINETTSQISSSSLWVCIGQTKVQDRVEKIAKEVFLLVRKEHAADPYVWLNHYYVNLSLTREPASQTDSSILGTIGCHIYNISKNQGIWVSTLNVKHNNNNGQYRGVGTALMQAAIELSQKLGRGGRISLSTANDSPPFYYSLGMRVMREEACEDWGKLSKEEQEMNADRYDARIKDVAEKWKVQQWDSMSYQDANKIRMDEVKDLVNKKMYLPDSEIKRWEATIQASPVLQESLDMQGYVQSLNT